MRLSSLQRKKETNQYSFNKKLFERGKSTTNLAHASESDMKDHMLRKILTHE